MTFRLKNYIEQSAKIKEAERWLRSSNDTEIATRCMFYLNRHAQKTQHNKALKQKIYSLKSRLIKKLYQEGYAVKVSTQRQVLRCWHTWEYNSGEENHCDRCFDTGIYRDHLLYNFVFRVGGRHYSWHQPESLVDFPVEITEESEGEYVRGEGEPNTLTTTALATYLFAVSIFLEIPIERKGFTDALMGELRCDHCNGAGFVTGRHWRDCYKCYGQGSRWKIVNGIKYKWANRSKWFVKEKVSDGISEDEIPF